MSQQDNDRIPSSQPDTPTTTVPTASTATGDTVDATLARAVAIPNDYTDITDLQGDNSENTSRETTAPAQDQPQQQPPTSRRNVDWGQGLAAARARRQSNNVRQNDTSTAPTPQQPNSLDTWLSRGQGPAATRPMTETRRMSRQPSGPQQPARRRTMTRPTTPPPALEAENLAYINQTMEAPPSPPQSPNSPPPTHMDASDIRDLEAHGVLDHGYLPTPSTQRQAPNEPLNLDGLTPELRDLVNQTINARVREADQYAQQRIQAMEAKTKQRTDNQHQQSLRRVEEVTVIAQQHLDTQYRLSQQDMKDQRERFQQAFNVERQRHESVIDMMRMAEPAQRKQQNRPLYSFTPCEHIVYPGPTATNEEYRNYLILIDGQLSQNTAVDDLMHGRIKHPVASNPTLMARLTNHYLTVMHNKDWTFEPRYTGLTIEVVRRTDNNLAEAIEKAMRDTQGRQPGESYGRLNKALFMAIHRTTKAVSRDRDLVSGVEHGVRASVFDGLRLYTDIKELAAKTKGLNAAEVKRNLINTLREPTYVPGPDGIKTMFATIKAARTDLGTMNPPTVFDDATVLLDVQRVLQRVHKETFIAALETIENNEMLHNTPTNMRNTEIVYKRYETRLLRMIKNNPKSFAKLDLTNVQTKQADVSGYESSSDGTNNFHRHGKGRGGRGRDRGHGRGRGWPSKRRSSGKGRGKGRGRNNKRARGNETADKHCIHHPRSVTHSTDECTNPYSTNSLWGDQGNETLSNEDWEERQAKGLGPPVRTCGKAPTIDPTSGPASAHASYLRGTQPTGQQQPPAYYGPPQQQQQPQHLQSHLAVNMVHPQQHQHQQLQQTQPMATSTDTRMVSYNQAQPKQPLQQQQWCQQTPTGMQQVYGYHPRTVPVTQINAQRQKQDRTLQPVDAMQAIMEVAKQYGKSPTYPTKTEVANFGRGGSFPRRF